MPYRHILVATDGSARSRRAIEAAVELARRFDARLTALFVLGQGLPTAFTGDKVLYSRLMSPANRAAAREAAEKALVVASRAAEAAGVRHASARVTSRAPWRAIVRAARAKNCDLIVMAAHGKRGLAALGSQTVKTVAHTRIPVLVCR
jgi:nucleotide-binding universal stress UspA family protein